MGVWCKPMLKCTTKYSKAIVLDGKLSWDRREYVTVCASTKSANLIKDEITQANNIVLSQDNKEFFVSKSALRTVLKDFFNQYEQKVGVDALELANFALKTLDKACFFDRTVTE